MNVLVRTDNLSHAEWLQWRNQGIGGSDAAAACGLSRWKSPVQLWMEKCGMLDLSEEPSEAARWGSLLESVIRQEFSLRTGYQVREEKAILQHNLYPCLIANIDGVVVDPKYGEGLLEIKCTNIFAMREWEHDGLPDEYSLQIQHYLNVTGHQFAYIATLFGGNNLQWRFVPRDESLIELLTTLEVRFWQLVESKTHPPINGSSASRELMNKLYPQGVKNSIVELPAVALSLIAEYEQARAEEYESMSSKEAAANQLKQLLGESETGVVQGRTVSWKNITSERLNNKLLKAEQPEIYKKYLESSVSRRFGIK